jgi:hypothetical protein
VLRKQFQRFASSDHSDDFVVACEAQVIEIAAGMSVKVLRQAEVAAGAV